ncbi:MAG: BTAD domain-containing putative transcriptional regulator [Erythrobacter sp.]|jgi:DNA-binding SARP family transcriptional activator/Tfp pilus assembly protein PilF
MEASVGYQQRRTEDPPYRFRLLGRFDIEPSDTLPVGRKACALLAYVALAQKPVDRAAVAALLWSGRGEQQAHASLRQCLHELKAFTTSVPPLLRADRHRISLEKSSLLTDVEAIVMLSTIGDAAATAELIPDAGGVLLADLEGIDPAFDDWLAIERAHWHDLIERAAIECGERALAAGNCEAVRELAARLAAFDPVNEAAARLEMAAAAQCGDRDGVRRVWHRIESALASDLGVGPAAETSALFKQLIEAPVARPVAVVTAHDAPNRGAAITRNRKLRLLASGITLMSLALTAGLAFRPDASPAMKIGFEQILARESNAANSALASHMAADFQRLSPIISREFSIVDSLPEKPGPAYPELLVRTMVERGGGQSKAQVQLVSTRDNSVLWSGSFSDESDNMTNLGLRAAGGLSTILRCAFKSLPQTDPLRSKEGTRTAFSACAAMQGSAEDSYLLTQTAANQMVKKNPELAAGWTLLAMTETRDIYARGADMPRPERTRLLEKAKRHAIKALTLDPANGLNYIVLADSLDPYESPKTLPSRLKIIEAGLRADPENSDLLARYGVYLFVSGYTQEAVPPLERAVSLDPTSPCKSGALVRRLMSVGRVDEAFEVQQRSEQIMPEHPEVKRQRLRMMIEKGDPKEALALYERLARTTGYPPAAGPLALELLRWRADPSRLNLQEIERKAEAKIATEPDSAAYIAAVFVQLGKIESAFGFLRSTSFRYLQHSILFWPDATPIRRYPRFFQLMNRIGLVDLWIDRGKWPDFCAEPGLGYDCAKEAAKLGKRPRPN